MDQCERGGREGGRLIAGVAHAALTDLVFGRLGAWRGL